MPKRAKYTGPSGTGVEFNVELDTGEIRPVHVEHGHLLPTDIGGTAVKASFRDALIASDDWTSVDQSTSTSTAAKDEPTTTKDKE